jgi:CRP-like cAMP-binding protein
MKTLLEFLKAHPVGRTLSKPEGGTREFLGATPKIYRPGSVLCRQGDDDDRVFFIKFGWALLYRGLSNGERQILDTPLKGDIIGLRAAAAGPRFASLASVTELSVFEVSGTELADAMRSDGLLGIKIAGSLARQNAILAEHLMNAGRRDAVTKIAHFLLELEERLSSAGMSALGRYECPLTQHELADILGMTTVHVNRTLGELRKADLISFRSGHVDVIDRKKLVRKAGFDREYLR